MASNNRVFVSPGVYTSEVDLTFVAQSVGVTTLGLAGETLKGPAFEPVLVSSFDEFKTYFGTTSPEKDGSDLPKYQLPYVAKSYLQESNQLFVTRVLGLTGYDAGKSFAIKTKSTNPDYNNITVAVLRSRGHYSGQTLVLQTMSASISDIDGIETNPMGNFTLQVSGRTGGSKSFTCSMDSTSKNYITKVLGSDVFDKDYGSYPLYVFEQYPNLLDSLVKQGLVTGLSLEIVSRNSAGAVTYIKGISSTGATKLLRGDTFRSRVKLPSPYFQLAP